MEAIIDQFADVIQHASEHDVPLCIRGSGSKDFYGGELQGEFLDARAYSGIVDYEPQELVLTARAGTTLKEINQALSDAGQMLPFEPPHFGDGATLGGCIAAGLSGPRRAYGGAVRDYVLGMRMLDGEARDLHFGGQVMKNVAGYDVSRLMAGSLGTLGLILEASLKVLPRPEQELTLEFEMDEVSAIHAMNTWAGQPLPLSATSYYDGRLRARLSGTGKAVAAAHGKIGGQVVNESDGYWQNLREQSLPFFNGGTSLWRISVPSATPPLPFSGAQFIEWGGALRWLISDEPDTTIRARVAAVNGQAILFRATEKKGRKIFHPLAPGLMEIHRRLKLTFDPSGIFNQGRMYEF
jgi:glycolate oxidase FAD binding subunit